MRRILMLVTVALVMAAMMVAMAMPAFADEGGVPDQNACQGQVISTMNTGYGFTLKEAAEVASPFFPGLIENVGDFTKLVGEGRIGVVDPQTGRIIACP
jgi:hypothetical protein